MMPLVQPRLQEEKGWTNLFTRNQGEGAIPNGTRIRKCKPVHRDERYFTVGSTGTILGSYEKAVMQSTQIEYYGYFVEWDSKPKHAYYCNGLFLEPIDPVVQPPGSITSSGDRGPAVENLAPSSTAETSDIGSGELMLGYPVVHTDIGPQRAARKKK